MIKATQEPPSNKKHPKTKHTKTNNLSAQKPKSALTQENRRSIIHITPLFLRFPQKSSNTHQQRTIKATQEPPTVKKHPKQTHTKTNNRPTQKPKHTHTQNRSRAQNADRRRKIEIASAFGMHRRSVCRPLSLQHPFQLRCIIYREHFVFCGRRCRPMSPTCA